MKIGNFDIDQRPMVIAEIGNNHEGDAALAERMITLAAEAGADAVKFQTLRADKLVSIRDQSRFNRIKSFELQYADFERLAQHAEKCGVVFLSTPFDLESAEFLDRLCPAFKIASGDNNFDPLLMAVANFKKPILLSTGAADMDRISHAKSLIENQWSQRDADPGLVLLHCVSAYPTAPNEANLAAIDTLRRAFGCPVGYSDHTLGIEAAVIAVARGAQVIEKHFTIDKNYSDFRDHQLSADPSELKELVRRVAEVVVLLGDGVKRVQAGEQTTAMAVQRRIVAAADLPAATTIGWEHLNWVRISEGLPAGQEHLLLGQTIKQCVCKGDPLHPQHCS